jgi:hypothetical protein
MAILSNTINLMVCVSAKDRVIPATDYGEYG